MEETNRNPQTNKNKPGNSGKIRGHISVFVILPALQEQCTSFENQAFGSVNYRAAGIQIGVVVIDTLQQGKIYHLLTQGWQFIPIGLTSSFNIFLFIFTSYLMDLTITYIYMFVYTHIYM